MLLQEAKARCSTEEPNSKKSADIFCKRTDFTAYVTEIIATIERKFKPLVVDYVLGP